MFVNRSADNTKLARVTVQGDEAVPGPLMLSAGFDVNGHLHWESGSVNCDKSAAGNPESAVHIREGGSFEVTAGGTWGTNSNHLVVTNSGTVTVDPTGTATINGSYTTLGRTILKRGTYLVNGNAIQQAPQAIFSLEGGNFRAHVTATNALAIWQGQLIGTGTIEGNLILGNQSGGGGLIAPGDTINANPTPANPSSTLLGIGTIDVTGNLSMMTGAGIAIDINGPAVGAYDRLRVVGQAALTGNIFGRLWRTHAPIPGGTRIEFLTYAQRAGDFTTQDIPDGWTKDKDGGKYWLQPPNTAVRGRAANDADGDGVFEPLDGETVLAGVQVELLDELGEPVVEPTTTDALGMYDFGAVEYGNYTVRFTRPSDLRPVQPGATYDEYADSDYDYATLTAGVTVGEASPFSDPYTDALFRPLVAVADTYYTPYRTAVGGNVLDNDPPAAGDTLTITLLSNVAHGELTLHPDGTFTYTPENRFHDAADTFTYRVTDSYGHTADAVVVIHVNPAPTAEVRGYVWRDLNGDGVHNSGVEYGVYDVTVQLLDETGAVVAEVQTGSGSVYFLFNVLPGTYRVRVLLPDGFAFTTPNASGGDDDSDVDEYGYSGFFTVAGGEFLDIDAGMLPPSPPTSPPPPPPPPPPPSSPPPPGPPEWP